MVYCTIVPGFQTVHFSDSVALCHIRYGWEPGRSDQLQATPPPPSPPACCYGQRSHGHTLNLLEAKTRSKQFGAVKTLLSNLVSRIPPWFLGGTTTKVHVGKAEEAD